jgi:hypothetical protein
VTAPPCQHPHRAHSSSCPAPAAPPGLKSASPPLARELLPPSALRGVLALEAATAVAVARNAQRAAGR